MSEPLISIRNLHVRREGFAFLEIPRLEIFAGEVLGVIGPNGAGKTTLMLALSGLIPYQSGEIRCDNRSVNPREDLAFRRRLAMVMQAPLLLHTSVEANIAAGLRFRRLDGHEIRRRVEIWAGRLSISHLLKRPAHKISGGEAQRVSLARALVLQPDLLILDEPFGALDAPTRAQLIADLKSLLATTRTTTLLVTHDLDEAMALSDRLAVLMEGRLRQVGSPHDIFSTPADTEIARFTGVETIFHGVITRQQDGCAEVNCGDFQVLAASSLSEGTPVDVCLRPEDIQLTPLDAPVLPPANGANRFRGSIRAIVPQGAMARVMIEGELSLAALIPRSSIQENNFCVGQPLQISFRPEVLHLIQG